MAAIESQDCSHETMVQLCSIALDGNDETQVEDASRVLLSRLYDQLCEAGDKDESRTLVLFAVLVLLANSISGAILRVHPPKPACHPHAKSGLVLILGYGGSSLDALGPYGTMWAGAGYRALTGTMPQTTHLSHRFIERLVVELETGLAAGTEFILHICSNNGWYSWSRLIETWQHHNLPPLESCLTKIVHDCCPADFDLKGEQAPIIAVNYAVGITRMLENFLKVPIDRQNQMRPVFEQIAASPEFIRLIWGNLEFKDPTQELTVPRLFLMSEADKLILPSLVQDYIERLKHVLRANGTREAELGTLFQVVKSTHAPHMMLGSYDPALLADAIHNFVWAGCSPVVEIDDDWKRDVKKGFVSYILSQT
eukprot:TRINITY_DN12871_c0_g1_i2.p1 TRINITY_DN12871_c0_g1~~TRINITY_DN12871_c0_g1_i2.p1  ORF type:complete len:368 (-),score=37.60 TRINITY_DN12871_c0_g1_i2:198-1301(-)